MILVIDSLSSTKSKEFHVEIDVMSSVAYPIDVLSSMSYLPDGPSHIL